MQNYFDYIILYYMKNMLKHTFGSATELSLFIY